MKSFSDSQGRNWSIDINVDTLRRVKSQTDVDLTKLVDARNETFQNVVQDYFLMFDLLHALVEPQFSKHGITGKEFGVALDEASLESAVRALIEAVIDFFREEKRLVLRKAFTKVMGAAERHQAEAIEKANKELDSPQFDQAVENAIGSMFGN